MLKAIFAGILLTARFASADVATFTKQEIQDHRDNIHQLAEAAADCLDQTYDTHLDFFEEWGISKYYGNRNPDYNTQAKLIAALKSYGKPPALVSELEPTSCIGLAMKCLEHGFNSVGMNATWEKIHDKLAVNNNFFGTDLQKSLINLGWKSYYWNPNPDKNAEWDAEDQKLNPLQKGKSWNPVWGGHAYRYAQALKGYYFEKDLYIHDATSLVGFGETQPAFFNELPLFIGTAHAGYHVFPGRYGDIIEAHSTRKLNSKENLEFSQFNPLASGGGPKWTKKEKYRSGVIVAPF